MVNTHNSPSSHPVTLYDGGGWFMAIAFFGIPSIFGSFLDFTWNYWVLRITYSILQPISDAEKHNDKSPEIRLRRRREVVYGLLITVLGFFIDYLYLNVAWGVKWSVPHFHIRSFFPLHGGNPPLEILSILLPMAALFIVNYPLARFYLRLKQKQAAILSAAMGFFTAPWLVLFIIMYQSYLYYK
ncbi:MAG: hypothetical protein ABSD79_04535 [Dehalococcoidales bacterium]